MNNQVPMTKECALPASWSLVIGHWSFIASLVIGYWSFIFGALSHRLRLVHTQHFFRRRHTSAYQPPAILGQTAQAGAQGGFADLTARTVLANNSPDFAVSIHPLENAAP